MSDIYYCSNSKSKKGDADAKNANTTRSTTKSNGSTTNNGCSNSVNNSNNINNNSNISNNNNHHNNNNNNNNNNSIRDNNTTRSKHFATNGKSNWNSKAVQTDSASCRESTKTTSSAATHGNGSIMPQKIYHNTRCTRHHSKVSHSNGADLSQHHHHIHSNHGHRKKSESVLSTDSDIRFTRRKLGDSQKCGCAVIAGFLIALLIAGAFVYVGYTYFRPEPLPDRVFRGKFMVLNDKWSMDLANQNSLRFQHKARDYRERINLLLRRSDLREAYEGSEILALDGTDNTNDVVVHFNMLFDPYAGLVSSADLLALFAEEFNSPQRNYFANLTVDAQTLSIRETTGLIDEPIMSSSSPLGGEDDTTEVASTTQRPPRRCEALKLNYCRHIGYNITVYPNLLGHANFEEVQADVIAYRELVDAECFREAFDFVCRLLQPPCETHGAYLEPTPALMCREYCQQFMKGCGNRLPQRIKRFFDCETFPESLGTQTCHQKPNCASDLQSNAQSPRLCDGIADCADASDERTCTFCNENALYCGRGRACVPRKARCDGKADCPDGADEKDCLSIAPLAADLMSPAPILPYLPRFHAEGYAVFSEKGIVGKLCAEGLEGEAKLIVRQTVAESLCKSLGYESVQIFEVRNDTESINDYVRVLDPHAPEISFIRTSCPRRQVLYVGCTELQCGVQSVLTGKQYLSLPKMSSPGDWPWLVALYREDIHVCDGTLISQDWVLTTESCFQGQPRATWLAIFGSVRLTSNAPWTQRRRIIGMIKSPVEGSTAALIRLETPVVYSDHVRPICLSDELQRKQEQQIQRRAFVAQAERLQGYASSTARATVVAQRRLSHETQQFFLAPKLMEQMAPNSDYGNFPHAEALTQNQNDLNAYPLPAHAPQMQYNTRSVAQPVLQEHYATTARNTAPKAAKPQAAEISNSNNEQWTNCNTLGWSRQRDHMQRVQLKIGDMAACENISIATVNSMCTEATYQKHDCTQEEYSGAPVQCLIPGTNQWALIGVSSWRIACGPSGVERPRMYDKITSNAAWIRETVNAVN